jgi:hypothetical protein
LGDDDVVDLGVVVVGGDADVGDRELFIERATDFFRDWLDAELEGP